ncbi:MAG: MJ1255/VC2487 family glycosyltransferase [Pseudohongiellaceae bacterium]
MKILYGVQGTGNGHISRANAMAQAMQAYPELQVDWLLSGREKSSGCGGIDPFLWREGMTFVVSAGRVDVLKTIKKNNLLQFRRDVGSLDLSPYELIISDYEPVVSHAARKRGLPVTGIGHQYAFNHKIPMRGANPVVKSIMKHYAPVTHSVGLHWHHFDCPILPPIIDLVLPKTLPATIENKVLVYLPFESPEQILEILYTMPDYEFYIYHPNMRNSDSGHIHCRSISRTGFKQNLLDARQVITNSGFELISECLHLGKSILSKPLQGQMEQLSNARALDELGYARIMEKLDAAIIRQWLQQQHTVAQVSYPDVAGRLAKWIATGCSEEIEALASELWHLH